MTQMKDKSTEIAFSALEKILLSDDDDPTEIEDARLAQEAGSLQLLLTDDYDTMGSEGSNAASENNSHAVFNLRNTESQTVNLHSRNGDGAVTGVNYIASKPTPNIHESISCGEICQEAFRNARMDNVNFEIEQWIASCDSSNNPVRGGINYTAVGNRQNNNSKSVDKKHSTRKKQIPLQRVKELMNQNMTRDAAAENLGVSESTLKRRLRKHSLNWPRSRKKKNPNENQNETHHANSSCGRKLSHLNSVDPSNLAQFNYSSTQHWAGIQTQTRPTRPQQAHNWQQQHNSADPVCPYPTSLPRPNTSILGLPPHAPQQAHHTQFSPLTHEPTMTPIEHNNGFSTMSMTQPHDNWNPNNNWQQQFANTFSTMIMAQPGDNWNPNNNWQQQR